MSFLSLCCCINCFKNRQEAGATESVAWFVPHAREDYVLKVMDSYLWHSGATGGGVSDIIWMVLCYFRLPVQMHCCCQATNGHECRKSRLHQYHRQGNKWKSLLFNCNETKQNNIVAIKKNNVPIVYYKTTKYISISLKQMKGKTKRNSQKQMNEILRLQAFRFFIV